MKKRGKLLTAKVIPCGRLRTGDVSMLYGKVISIVHFMPFSSERVEIKFEGEHIIVRGLEESIEVLS